MYQLEYAFLQALLAILWNVIWLLFRHFRQTSPGILPELNSKISVTSTPPYNTTTKCCMLVPASSKKAIALLTPQQHLNEEATPKRCLYHMPSEIPYTCELSPKWMEIEEVLCWLRGEVNPCAPSYPRSLPNWWTGICFFPTPLIPYLCRSI